MIEFTYANLKGAFNFILKLKQSNPIEAKNQINKEKDMNNSFQN